MKIRRKRIENIMKKKEDEEEEYITYNQRLLIYSSIHSKCIIIK